MSQKLKEQLLIDQPQYIVKKQTQSSLFYSGSHVNCEIHKLKKVKVSHLYSAFPQNFHHIKGTLQ